MRTALALLALCLTSCDEGDGYRKPPSSPDNSMAASSWEIGPINTNDGRNKNYSVNMPLHPATHSEGWALDFGPDSEPHYVTFAHGSLSGKAAITMSFRAEAAPEVRIHGAGCSVESPGQVTLYFERRDEDFSTDGTRWWATFATKYLFGADEATITAPLDGPWTSVVRKTSDNAPGDFADAKRNANRVGFTFGNCNGYGHGIRATGPVKFVVTNFSVQ